ncbi:unnamed protein product [Auanema sp. JU1783]|nr:unnamed protein product [Auanema sp. JU1783]
MSFYVPLVLRLEIKGKSVVNFNESSKLEIAASPSEGERTRRRLMSGMKKRSPPAPSDTDAPLALDRKCDRNTSPITNFACAGRRTYSEVVLETYEGDRLTQCSESSAHTSKLGSEAPPDISHINYYYGNPCVEKTEGILHFFKYSDEGLAKQAQCRMLCMISVPSHQTIRDLISLIGPSLHYIERLKIVRDSKPNQFMVIIKFKTHNDTVQFFEEYNGMQFNSLEPEHCRLLFVDRLECTSDSDIFDISGLTELPTCTVCLERMDDGVLTILCNHTFHAVCLQQWTDTTCPVCRFVQTPELEADQRCVDCSQTTDLWLCLVCGNVGCGRYASAHAFRHFEETAHTFCLQVGGERVWDYAGDNYVHRLIQTDTEGKLVEYQRGVTQDVEKDDKIEGMKMEYTCLLTSQLENQRKFFEARLNDVERAMCNMEKLTHTQMEDLERKLAISSNEIRVLTKELDENKSLKSSFEKKHQTALNKLNKVTSELNEERSMNTMLRSDQQKWKENLDKATKERKEIETFLRTQIKDMEEQVRDLMVHFDAKDKLETHMANSHVTQEEVESSQIGVNSPSKESNLRKGRRSGRK